MTVQHADRTIEVGTWIYSVRYKPSVLSGCTRYLVGFLSLFRWRSFGGDLCLSSICGFPATTDSEQSATADDPGTGVQAFREHEVATVTMICYFKGQVDSPIAKSTIKRTCLH